MRIVNLRNNAILADKAKIANTFFSRAIGLLNRGSLEQGEALILRPSNAIHMLFMRFPIDALFVDKNDKIVGILSSIKPFQISKVYFQAILTIELPANCVKNTKTVLGDVIKFE